MQRPSDWVRDTASPPFTFHFSPFTFHQLLFVPRTPQLTDAVSPPSNWLGAQTTCLERTDDPAIQSLVPLPPLRYGAPRLGLPERRSFRHRHPSRKSLIRRTPTVPDTPG